MPVYAHELGEALVTIRLGITHSVNEMQMNVYAAPYAVVFENLRKDCDVVYAQELAFNDLRSEADARVDAAGEKTCEFVNRLHKEVLLLTGGKRENALYTVFFGDQTLADFKKPLRSGDFTGVGSWGLTLDETPHAALKPFAAEWKALSAAADEALKARTEVEHAWKHFREVGERAQFINKLNAARKQVHGELSKLRFEHVGLPGNFADRFFTHRKPRPKAADAEPTVESVKEELAQLKAEIAVKEGLLSELVAKAAEAKKKEEELKAEAAAVEALEKQAAEALALAAKKKEKLAAAAK